MTFAAEERGSKNSKVEFEIEERLLLYFNFILEKSASLGYRGARDEMTSRECDDVHRERFRFTSRATSTSRRIASARDG